MNIYSVKMWSDIGGETKLTARLYYKKKAPAKEMFETLSGGGDMLNSRKSVILEREDLEENKWSILEEYNDMGVG